VLAGFAGCAPPTSPKAVLAFGCTPSGVPKRLARQGEVVAVRRVTIDPLRAPARGWHGVTLAGGCSTFRESMYVHAQTNRSEATNELSSLGIMREPSLGEVRIRARRGRARSTGVRALSPRELTAPGISVEPSLGEVRSRRLCSRTPVA
jgi:hypothetical protein